MSFLNVFKHLLPNAKAWRLTSEKQLRQFFKALSDLPQNIRDYYDLIFNDLDPQKTRQLDEWEHQFGLPPSTLPEQDRRDRLDAAWKNQGGQSPYYIQSTLQAAGFNVFVHDAWITEGPPATYQDPTVLLSGGVRQFVMMDGGTQAQDGRTDSQDGKSLDPAGYPLVNIVGTPPYTIPTDPATFPYYVYIGGEVFGEVANVQQSRRDEFEYLCLKVCPTHLWIGVFVVYS